MSTADPRILVSVREAARMVSMTPWQVYRLCDAGAIESGYHDGRRLVLVESLHAWAKSLPSIKPEVVAV